MTPEIQATLDQLNRQNAASGVTWGYDESKGVYYSVEPNGVKRYQSNTGMPGDMSASQKPSGGGLVHGSPEWDQKTGTWKVPLDWGKIGAWGVGGALGLGALDAVGALGGGAAAAGGAGAAPEAAAGGTLAELAPTAGGTFIPGAAAGAAYDAAGAGLIAPTAIAAPAAATTTAATAAAPAAAGPTASSVAPAAAAQTYISPSAAAAGSAYDAAGAGLIAPAVKGLTVDPLMLALFGGSAAASLFGAHMQSSAAKEAAKIQAESADKALGVLKDIYTQQRSDQLPWLNTGRGAISTLNRLTGVDSNPAAAQPTWSSTPTATDRVPPSAAPLSAMAGAGAPIPGSGTIMLRAPNGETQAVAPQFVDQFLARGAVKV